MTTARLLAVVGFVFFAHLASGADAVPQGNPRVAAEAWAGVLEARPRLLGPRERLRQLAQEKADIYQHQVKREAPLNLQAAGIVHALEGLPPEQIQPWIEKAKKTLARGVTNRHQETWMGLDEVAQVYDYFHDAIRPTNDGG